MALCRSVKPPEAPATRTARRSVEEGIVTVLNYRESRDSKICVTLTESGVLRTYKTSVDPVSPHMPHKLIMRSGGWRGSWEKISAIKTTKHVQSRTIAVKLHVESLWTS